MYDTNRWVGGGGVGRFHVNDLHFATERRFWSVSKPFDTLIDFLIENFKNYYFNHKYTCMSMQSVKSTYET